MEAVADSGSCCTVSGVARADLAAHQQQAGIGAALDHQVERVEQQVETFTGVEEPEVHDRQGVLIKSELLAEGCAIVVEWWFAADVGANRNEMMAWRWSAKPADVALVGADDSVTEAGHEMHCPVAQPACTRKQVGMAYVVESCHHPCAAEEPPREQRHEANVAEQVEGAGLKLDVDDARPAARSQQPEQGARVPATDLASSEDSAGPAHVGQCRPQPRGIVANPTHVRRIFAADEQDHPRNVARRPRPITRRRARRSGTREPNASFRPSSMPRAMYSSTR